MRREGDTPLDGAGGDQGNARVSRVEESRHLVGRLHHH